MATTLPTTSLHGTAPETLLDDYQEGLTAINRAMVMLQSFTVPNARDYPGEAFALAMAEHQARMKQLHGIHAELEAIAENLADVVCTRSDRRREQAAQAAAQVA